VKFKICSANSQIESRIGELIPHPFSFFKKKMYRLHIFCCSGSLHSVAGSFTETGQDDELSLLVQMRFRNRLRVDFEKTAPMEDWSWAVGDSP
jgi:hypothetical protein